MTLEWQGERMRPKSTIGYGGFCSRKSRDRGAARRGLTRHAMRPAEDASNLKKLFIKRYLVVRIDP
jgi:hypothetical protein